MGKSRVLYDNILRMADAVINVSASDPGFPAQNVATWRVYDKWSASGNNQYIFEFTFTTPKTIDSVVLSGHNLYSCGARFKLDGFNVADSSGVAVTPLLAYTTPTSNKTIGKYITPATFDGFILTIDNNGGADFIPEIGIILLCEYLEIPRNPSLPFNPDAQKDNDATEYGTTGNALGNVEVFSLREMTINYNNLPTAFVSGDWKTFYDNGRRNPFIFNWDSSKDEFWLTKWEKPKFDAEYKNTLYRDVALPIQAVVE